MQDKCPHEMIQAGPQLVDGLTNDYRIPERHRVHAVIEGLYDELQSIRVAFHGQTVDACIAVKNPLTKAAHQAVSSNSIPL